MSTNTFTPGPISQADTIYPYTVQPADLRPNGAWRLEWLPTQQVLGTFPTYVEAQVEAERRITAKRN